MIRHPARQEPIPSLQATVGRPSFRRRGEQHRRHLLALLPLALYANRA